MSNPFVGTGSIAPPTMGTSYDPALDGLVSNAEGQTDEEFEQLLSEGLAGLLAQLDLKVETNVQINALDPEPVPSEKGSSSFLMPLLPEGDGGGGAASAAVEVPPAASAVITAPEAGVASAQPEPMAIPSGKTDSGGEAPSVMRFPGLEYYFKQFPAGWEQLVKDHSGASETNSRTESDSVKLSEGVKAAVEGSIVPGPVSTGDGKSVPRAGATGTVVDQDRRVLLTEPESGRSGQAPEQGGGDSGQVLIRETKVENIGPETGGHGPAASAAEAQASSLGKLHIPRQYQPTQPAAGATENAGQVLARLTEAQKDLTIENLAHKHADAWSGKPGSVTVELHPPELGRVRVEVSQIGDKIQTALTVQDAEIGQFLQERQEQLKQQLAQAGVTVGELSVEVNRQWQEPDGRPEQQKSREENSGSAAVEAAHKKAKTFTPAPQRSSDGRIDLTI